MTLVELLAVTGVEMEVPEGKVLPTIIIPLELFELMRVEGTVFTDVILLFVIMTSSR